MSDTSQQTDSAIVDAKISKPDTWTFGTGQFNKITPEFARNIFDMYFIISKAVVGWLAAIQILTTRHEFVVTMTITLLLDVIVKGLTKMFGVTIEDSDTKTNN